jgi:hypothetical protein
MDKSQSDQDGVSNPGTTEPHPDMPSSNAVKAENTSVTLDTTAPASPDSQATEMLPENIMSAAGFLNMIQTYAEYLMKEKAVYWLPVKRKTGETGFALFFPSQDFEIKGDKLCVKK